MCTAVTFSKRALITTKPATIMAKQSERNRQTTRVRDAKKFSALNNRIEMEILNISNISISEYG